VDYVIRARNGSIRVNGYNVKTTLKYLMVWDLETIALDDPSEGPPLLCEEQN